MKGAAMKYLVPILIIYVTMLGAEAFGKGETEEKFGETQRENSETDDLGNHNPPNRRLTKPLSISPLCQTCKILPCRPQCKRCVGQYVRANETHVELVSPELPSHQCCRGNRHICGNYNSCSV